MPCPIFTGFDIETKPNPEAVTRFLKPFPDFREEDVKTGNLKDPIKIAEKLRECRAQHDLDRRDYIQKAHDDAALNPFTATIIVIGLINEDGAVVFLEGAEKSILTLFWMHFQTHGDAARKFVYWSGCGASENNFDLDFIVTRSRLTGVAIPAQVRNGRNYSSRIVDLASEFLLHKREAYLSLTKAADLFGLYDDSLVTNIQRKHDGDACTGANFWLWYEGKANADDSATDQRSFALKYLRNDLCHVWHLAPRIL